ncbi:acyl-CoA thioesterase [Microbacterium marinilacus]|uniref:Thioesterase family protein n=1 Tax=Microbacterium marinilacus TaxID=415209 RepID=A0ABP7B2Z8_9MICO|nr:thioesterase family protein [Microbacterium marinilacus]MBY0688516.1 acyl-CoA thioesterase [Microbacterium marinilacus]
MTRVHIPIHRRWGDLDALGHVNNTSMLKLLEEARLRAFWRSEDPADQAPTAVFGADVLEGDGAVATLIARQEIEYLRPVPYGHKPLDVQLWIGRLGGSSVEVCYEVFGPASAAPAGDEPPPLYARASSVVVLVDTASGRPTRLPADVREVWAPYVGEPIAFARR